MVVNGLVLVYVEFSLVWVLLFNDVFLLENLYVFFSYKVVILVFLVV